jgi:hypothetical protein
MRKTLQPVPIMKEPQAQMDLIVRIVENGIFKYLYQYIVKIGKMLKKFFSEFSRVFIALFVKGFSVLFGMD